MTQMNNPYETDELLNQYLGFHYGSDYFDVRNYAVNCAELCIQAALGRPTQKALDLGCAVGRSTFELAKAYSQVVGIDYSCRFIEAAQQLQAGESLPYALHDQGELRLHTSASLAQLDLNTLADKVQFEVGDACQLAPHHVNYDLIFAGNLIDRVSNPAAFLNDMHHRINQGGLLIISSPYTLLTQYTPRENWLGGFTQNGLEYTMLDGMRDILSSHFKMTQKPIDVPFVIRETSRKFQHSIAELTVWERLKH